MTTETPDLDTLLGLNQPQTKANEYDQLALKLLETREKMDALKALETAIVERIVAQTKEDVGVEMVDGNQYSFTVERTELWKWDNIKVEQTVHGIINQGDAVPDCVETKMTVNKKKYQAMNASEQSLFHHALTRKPSKAKVKVAKHQNQTP